jgi:Periplasmic copper-binding protein (NosD)
MRQGSAPSPITECPTTIIEPGSYVLVTNLLFRAGDCLVVAADFVTIDLAGFAITGNGTGSGIRDQVTRAPAPRQGITVRNGTVANFLHGILLQNTVGAMVEDMRVINNSRRGQGILVGRGVSGSGDGIVRGNIVFDAITGINIEGGIVSGNIATGNAAGIFVITGVVSGNTIAGNQAGLGVQGGTVTGNTVRDNSSGIFVFAGSTVTGNTTTGNDVGPGIEAEPGSTVSRNTARDNIVGIRARSCPSALIENTATANDFGQIDIFGFAPERCPAFRNLQAAE